MCRNKVHCSMLTITKAEKTVATIAYMVHPVRDTVINSSAIFYGLRHIVLMDEISHLSQLQAKRKLNNLLSLVQWTVATELGFVFAVPYDKLSVLDRVKDLMSKIGDNEKYARRADRIIVGWQTCVMNGKIRTVEEFNPSMEFHLLKGRYFYVKMDGDNSLSDYMFYIDRPLPLMLV